MPRTVLVVLLAACAALLPAPVAGAQSRSDRDPTRDVHLQLVAPVRLRLTMRVVSARIPDCVTVRRWEGTLAPRDHGRRVAGVLQNREWYEGRGCDVLANREAVGLCTGENRGAYDAAAAVSGAEVPDGDQALSSFASRSPRAWAEWRLARGPDAPGRARMLIRTRLEMTLALRAGTIGGTNSCVLASPAGYAGVDRLFAGKPVPVPPFLLPEPGERGELVHHLGGGNEIRVEILR